MIPGKLIALSGDQSIINFESAITDSHYNLSVNSFLLYNNLRQHGMVGKRYETVSGGVRLPGNLSNYHFTTTTFFVIFLHLARHKHREIVLKAASAPHQIAVEPHLMLGAAIFHLRYYMKGNMGWKMTVL